MRLTLAGALSGSLAASLASAGVAFGLHAMLAGLAGAEQYGTYSYVLAWTGVLVLISTLGLDVSLVKYVAAYHAQDRRAHLRGIVRWSYRVVLASACAIGALAAAAGALGRAVWRRYWFTPSGSAAACCR